MSGGPNVQGAEGGREDRLSLLQRAVPFQSAPWAGQESEGGGGRGAHRPRSLQALGRTTEEERVRASVPRGLRCAPRPCPRRGWAARSGRAEMPAPLFPRRGAPTAGAGSGGVLSSPRRPSPPGSSIPSSSTRRPRRSAGGRPGGGAHILGLGPARGNDPSVHGDGRQGRPSSQRGSRGVHR